MNLKNAMSAAALSVLLAHSNGAYADSIFPRYLKMFDTPMKIPSNGVEISSQSSKDDIILSKVLRIILPPIHKHINILKDTGQISPSFNMLIGKFNVAYKVLKLMGHI